MDAISTQRLTLRPFRSADVDAVLAYADDEAFGRYIPGVPHPYGREDAESFVARMREPTEDDLQLAICLGSRVIGGASLVITDGAAMLGYGLGRAWWGNGYATEVARALVDAAFAHPDVAVVWAWADARNTASLRVLRKAGLTPEGIARQRRTHRGERVDEHHHSILRTEWLDRD